MRAYFGNSPTLIIWGDRALFQHCCGPVLAVPPHTPSLPSRSPRVTYVHSLSASRSRGAPAHVLPLLLCSSSPPAVYYLLQQCAPCLGQWCDLTGDGTRHGSSTDYRALISILFRRYLDRWEKVHYLGEEADRGSDDDEESRHKRWSARALHSVPHTYNYTQHNITGEWVVGIRQYSGQSSCCKL